MKVFKYITYGLSLSAILFLGYMAIVKKNANELGLEVFTIFKSVSGNQVHLDKIKSDNPVPLDHSEWSTLLTKHVNSEGKVNYKGFLEDRLLLEEYLDLLSDNPPTTSSLRNEKLAYWINAYNAFTIKLIIDNYPLKSIKDISSGLPMINSPWDIKFFKIGTVDFDLNTIEHEILRKKFDDPRIHFAINCASYSCPKLRNEAYNSNRLEQQLSEQAIDFIMDSNKNQISQTVLQLSSIFNWFESDFTKNGSLIEYLSQFDSRIDKKKKVTFLKYDWTLNEK